MPSFGTKSSAVLTALHPTLRGLMTNVVEHYDITLLEGHRTQLRQNKLYFDGQSKVSWPDSRHNTTPSMAVDVAPWPIPHDWGNLGRNTGTDRDNAWKERLKFYQMVAVINSTWVQMQTANAFAEESHGPQYIQTNRLTAHRYRIRFGADWDGDNDYRDQTFDDLVHVEIWPIQDDQA